MPTRPLELRYADVPARSGIVYEKRPDGILIVIQRDWLERWLPLLFRPAVIEVTPVGLRLDGCRPDTKDQQSVNLFRPREAVYAVRYVPHARRIAVHARGHEMVLCRPHSNPDVMGWIAGAVSEALGLGEQRSADGPTGGG